MQCVSGHIPLPHPPRPLPSPPSSLRPLPRPAPSPPPDPPSPPHPLPPSASAIVGAASARTSAAKLDFIHPRHRPPDLGHPRGAKAFALRASRSGPPGLGHPRGASCIGRPVASTCSTHRRCVARSQCVADAGRCATPPDDACLTHRRCRLFTVRLVDGLRLGEDEAGNGRG